MRYSLHMDNDDTTPCLVPAGWLDVLNESDADLAAGRVVSADTVHAELRASIARLEAAQLDADRVDPSQQTPRHSATSSRH